MPGQYTNRGETGAPIRYPEGTRVRVGRKKRTGMKLHKVPAAIEGGNDPDFYEGLISRLGDFLVESPDDDMSRSLNSIVEKGGAFVSAKQAGFLYKQLLSVSKAQARSLAPDVKQWASKFIGKGSFVITLTQFLRGQGHGKNTRSYGRAYVIDGAGVVAAGKLKIDHNKQDGTQGLGITGIQDTVFERKSGVESQVDIGAVDADATKAAEQLQALGRLDAWDDPSNPSHRIVHSFADRLRKGMPLSVKQEPIFDRLVKGPPPKERAAANAELVRLEKLMKGGVGYGAEEMLYSFKARVKAGQPLTPPMLKQVEKLEKYQVDLRKVISESWKLLRGKVVHAEVVYKKNGWNDPKPMFLFGRMQKGEHRNVQLADVLRAPPAVLSSMVELQSEIDKEIVDYPQRSRYGHGSWTYIRGDGKKWLKKKQTDAEIEAAYRDIFGLDISGRVIETPRAFAVRVQKDLNTSPVRSNFQRVTLDADRMGAFAWVYLKTTSASGKPIAYEAKAKALAKVFGKKGYVVDQKDHEVVIASPDATGTRKAEGLSWDHWAHAALKAKLPGGVVTGFFRGRSNELLVQLSFPYAAKAKQVVDALKGVRGIVASYDPDGRHRESVVVKKK